MCSAEDITFFKYCIPSSGSKTAYFFSKSDANPVMCLTGAFKSCETEYENASISLFAESSRFFAMTNSAARLSFSSF